MAICPHCGEEVGFEPGEVIVVGRGPLPWIYILGMVISVLVSWDRNHSVWMAIISGILSWFYLIWVFIMVPYVIPFTLAAFTWLTANKSN